MIINHNLGAMNANRNMGINATNANKSMEKLSSGLRINKAGDDAAGLAISEKMRGQIRGLDQSSANAQNAISLIGTGEGALNETQSILQRMRELAVQSSSDTNVGTDRKQIQGEVDQLAKEISRISNDTEFNQKNLLGGNLNDTYQVGANKDQNIQLSIKAMDAKSLGVSSDANVMGTFVPSTTTLTSSAISNSDLGKGLTQQVYTIDVTHNAATAVETGDTISGGGAVTAQTFTGDRTEANVQFKVTAVGANKVTAMDYTTDGGSTWSSASVNSAAADSIVTYKGATLTMTSAVGNAAGQTFTATFAARNDTIQLKDAGAVAVGSAVTAYGDMNSVSLGDAASSRTITINSTSLGDLTTGAATQGVNKLLSSAAGAVSSDGTMTKAVVQAGIDVSSQSAANTAIKTINDAIETVSTERSKLGAYTNRLEHTIANLGTSSENLTSAESRIRDVDMAKEMSTFSKNNILNQAAQAMLAQANQQPQQVLALLR